MILQRSGVFYDLVGALPSMEADEAMEVVNGVSIATLSDGSYCSIVVNQALLNPTLTHYESLLQPHQCRAHGVIVDDTPTRYLGADGHPGEHIA